jgi:hypothetical protein
MVSDDFQCFFRCVVVVKQTALDPLGKIVEGLLIGLQPHVFNNQFVALLLDVVVRGDQETDGIAASATAPSVRATI